jgi:DNA primase/energy-coupling factor transporter ATP-binding protein EcfA2
MEIQDIKQQLTLAQVLKYYNLKPDKQSRLNCPFHDDKTPSFQVYYKTHTGFCFSSNCKTNGKSLDVIDFIMYKEGWEMLGAEGKHKAIVKAMEIGGIKVNEKNTNEITVNPAPCTIDKVQFLTNMFTYFKNAVHNSKPAQDYIKQRGLNKEQLEVGYNSGQFHHGNRKDAHLISQCLKYGLLLDRGIKSKTGDKAYRPFGKYCIVFALRNRANQVTGLYLRSSVNDQEQKHYYLKDRTGLYPRYPKSDTEILILTEAVIDAASLLQIQTTNEELQNCEVLACYGTNGLTKEHITAIKELKQLNEIIFAFDNDEAGNKAVVKYSSELNTLLPKVSISKIELPENEDINSTYLAHQSDVFTHLINERLFLFQMKSIEKEKKQIQDTDNKLETKNPYKLRYATNTANYYIQGGISKMLDSMKTTIVIEHSQTQQKARNKIDLYEDKQVEKLCKEVAEKLNLRKDLLEADIYKLTDLLDEYRETELKAESEKFKDEAFEQYPLTAIERQQVESYLKQEKLIYKLNELLGKSGIAGEETNRIFLLIIAISYKMPEPLHALIQGSSGSGKTKLLRQISDCMPPERVIRLTRVSDKGFYNYPEKYLRNKLVSLEDVDGLGEEANFAFRELQSNGELNSATSVKLENGQIVSGEKRVKGPIASLACTTQGEIYEDNMSRVFLIAVDESQEQTKRIIMYQNNKAAGQIDVRKEQDIKRFIQNMVREIKPYEALNPYANQIQLPEEAYKIRRLNELFQSFIKMITVINQYQRKKDEKGRLITEITDIETAIDIMFESIVLKVDELDGSLRQFYEKLKKYVEKKGKSFEFSRFEVREATGLGKTQQHHYLNKLLELEYLQQYGFANRGFKYKIVYWDNYVAIREKIKQYLQEQLEQLKNKSTEHQTGENAQKRTPANTSRTPEIVLNN